MYRLDNWKPAPLGQFVARAFALVLCVVAVLATRVEAEGRPDPAIPQGENLAVPEGWIVRTDHQKDDLSIGSEAGSSDIYFVNMTPGWHITSGPAAIYFHPESVASGRFEVSSVLHLFDPGERQREAFGILFGGRALQSTESEYLYFLIRNTGDFLIKRRLGTETSVLKDWTPSTAIVRFTEETETSAANTLRVKVEGEVMVFSVNGQPVAELPRENVVTDGVVGFRINHGVNLHISDLQVKPLSGNS